MNFVGEINEMSSDWFMRELDKCPSRSAVDIFIDTPGGDIYAGGRMVIAARKAMKERGLRINLELGAIVASMGASLVAAVKASGGKVVAHANSSVMFHGCYGIVIGGADELRDNADAMDVFNGSVKEDLKKCGIEDTEEWFAADRQKWLGAKDMLEIGLIDEIYEADAEATADRVVADRLAAKFNHQENPMNEEPKAEEVQPEAVAAPEAQTEVAAPAAEETAVAKTPAETPAEAPAAEAEQTPAEAAAEAPEAALDGEMVARADFQAFQAIKDREISNLKNEITHLNEELNATKTALTNLRAEAEAIQAKAIEDAEKAASVKLEAKDAEIAELQAKHAKVISPALAHSEPVTMTAQDIAAARMSAEDKVRALLKH